MDYINDLIKDFSRGLDMLRPWRIFYRFYLQIQTTFNRIPLGRIAHHKVILLNNHLNIIYFIFTSHKRFQYLEDINQINLAVVLTLVYLSSEGIDVWFDNDDAVILDSTLMYVC